MVPRAVELSFLIVDRFPMELNLNRKNSHIKITDLIQSKIGMYFHQSLHFRHITIHTYIL